MSIQNKKVIKKTYDQYTTQDFIYGSDSSDNLNPKREIHYDAMDEVYKKLQAVTNDIIRKRIQPNIPEELLRAAAGGEALPMGISPIKQMALLGAGSIGNALIFPVITDSMEPGPIESSLEFIIGTFPPVPGLLDELDNPPQLDCDMILGNLDAKHPDVLEKEEEREKNDNGEDGNGSTGNQLEDDEEDEPEEEEGEDAEDDTDSDDGNLSELAECAQIELTWLKIILILVKIIKILQLIICLILAILTPIIEIIRLAVGAWINPPNIAKIVQEILKAIMAIILLILALILQLIWNLLNLDCITDQTVSMINQIQRAMSAFGSIMNAFNPTAVAMMMDKLDKGILDPIADIKKDLEKGKENWAKFKDDLLGAFSPDKMKQLMEDTKKGMLDTIKQSSFGTAANRLKSAAMKLTEATKKTAEQMKKLKDWNKKDNAVVKKGKLMLTKAKGIVGMDST